ncbi:MAG: ATP phosphoribosyltransferase regulatory subunit, partial [Firmicutes bacterium]|nr:ATP phosphoribosyltransferase regulatory subunit [Bacillota bacterium]
KLTDITVAIDKIEKVGIEKVKEELVERGLSADAINKLEPILSISGTTAERLDKLSSALAGSETGQLGIGELREVISGVEALGLNAQLELDVSLARGLNYYTGTIIEVKARDVAIGSITGGGRYDNLTGVFGMPGLSGVGISFGADRIYDVLNQLDLYPADATVSTQVMFVNFGKEEATASMRMLQTLRQKCIRGEIYPDCTKMKKQMGRADALGIPFVAIVGENELAQGKLMLKDMQSGRQQLVTPDEAVEIISRHTSDK